MQERGGWNYGGELAERAGHRKEVVGEDKEISKVYIQQSRELTTSDGWLKS